MVSRILRPTRRIAAGLVILLAAAVAKPDEAANAINAANDMVRAHDYSGARSRLESAMMNYKGDPRTRAALLNNLAGVYDAMGDYDHAEKTYREAVADAQESIRSGDLEFLTPVSNLLGLYLQYGQVAKADRFSRQLYATGGEWRTARHINVARLFSLSGAVALRCERFGEAESLLLHADELLNGIKPPALADRAVLENNLAMLYRFTGRSDMAREHVHRAYDVLMSIGNADPGELALILVNRALLERLAGAAGPASEMFERGMAAAQTVVPSTQPIMADILGTAAEYMRIAGRKREAKQLAKRADAIRNTISQDTSIGKTVDYESFRSRSR